MPVDYSKIKNKKLVAMIQDSASLAILPEALKQEYINKIVNLPDKGEVELLALLEKQAKAAPKLSNEEKIAIFEAGTKALQSMMKAFKKDCRVEGEKIERAESEHGQEDLLKELEDVE